MSGHLKEVARLLVKYGLVRLNREGQVSTGSSKRVYKAVSDRIIEEVDLTRSQERDLETRDTELTEECLDILRENANKESGERLEALRPDYGDILDELPTLVDSAIDLSSYRVFNDYGYTGQDAPSRGLLIRNKFKETADIGHSVFYRIHRQRFPNKGDWEMFRDQLQYGIEIYDPYKILEVKEDRYFAVEKDGTPMVGLNTCKHPSYRYLNTEDANPIDKRDQEFIESCFDNQGSIKYFYQWTYHAITQRVPVYLVLLGVRQIGKTTLVEILSEMVGQDNFFSSAQNGLISNFDGYKENRRIIEFDEMQLDTQQAVNRVKKDANEVISVEKKGQDTRNTQNFFSGIISSNSARDFRGLAFDERRLSFVDLTADPTFKRGFSDDWMSEFKSRIKTEEWQLSFFKLLKESTVENFKPHKPYKGTTFYTTLEENLSGAYLVIMEKAISGLYSCIYMHEVKQAMEDDRYFPKHHSNFSDFVNNYRHGKEKLSLGSYLRARTIEDSYILVSDHFRPTETEETL